MKKRRKMHETRIFDITIEICVIFLIVFMPFAFGGVGLGLQIILVSICELMFFLALFKSAISGQPIFINTIFSYLFFFFLAIVFFQTIPLPPFVLKLLSPSTYRIYLDFLPGYQGNNIWRAISIHPQATNIELFKTLSYGIAAFLVIKNFNKKIQITRILKAISAAGFILACFGIIQRFTWNGMIYWIQPVPEGVMAFGPFVNKNHFAGFMELSIPMTAAFVFIADRIEKKVFFGFMTLVMLLALFLSLSRAGILSFCAATTFVFLAVLLRRSSANSRLTKYIFYMILAFLIACTAIFFIAKDPLIEKFLGAPAAFLRRTSIYKDIFRMFGDFPVFGIGAGSFASIFAKYKSFNADMVFTHADSDWLQFLAETGLAGFLCIATSMWLFFKDILYCHFLGKGRCAFERQPSQEAVGGMRHDRFVLAVILGGLISMTSIILHATVDINLHIPSNAFLFCIIAAILITVAHNRFHKENDLQTGK